MPLAAAHHAEDGSLKAIGTHIAILAHGGRVPCQRAVAVVPHVAETVFARGIGKLAVKRQAHRAAQLVLPTEAGIDQAEGARLERHVEVVTLAALELGPAGAQIDGACRAIVLGALENVAALTVIERDGLDIVEREFAQIHLTILRIADLDAVVKDPHVVGAHRADVYRLEAAHTTIVLELHTGKVAHGIGHRVTVQALELLAREFLGRNHILVGATAIDDYILDVLHRVESAMAHAGHHRVGLMREDALLCMGAQDTDDHIECYNYYRFTHLFRVSIFATWQVF